MLARLPPAQGSAAQRVKRMNPQTPPVDTPHLRVLAQYVKDLSFQNIAAAGGQAYDQQPSIDMGVEVKSRPMGADGDAAEVDLCISVEARRNEATIFSVSLVYSGVFQFVAVHAEEIEPLIWIECPRLLFPFARHILAEITREGGYPPLLINPIDFTPLYWAELRDRDTRAEPANTVSELSDFQPQSSGA
jgi:preprotein translocase subunit SecB